MYRQVDRAVDEQTRVDDAPEGRAVVAGGTLYLVALPIGNLRDISFRAVDVLRAVDLIAAEDTRHLEKYRRAYQIRTRAVSYHNFNEQSRARQLLDRLLGGESVALVSDAGTPLVSDPGFRVVREATAAGVPVVSLPGACAAIVALSVSGLPGGQFRFLGFPPRAAGQRQAFFRAAALDSSTLVFYESPHRLTATLEDLRFALGERRICLARDLTKPDERVQRGSISEVLAELADEEPVRGEATVVVAGAEPDAGRDDARADATEDARRLLATGVDTKRILEQMIALHGLKRREAYDLILRLRAGRLEPDGIEE